jgi:hypothetical protein
LATQGVKQVCNWYACNDCRDLQNARGVINITGLASDHNGNFRRWKADP